ncbi:MAG: hypothetical protein OXB84_06705 [Halobacteriovoraceae bacterium]|nr:hypothetical protein [Halobacteriovoraceae bacterium]
MINDNTAEIFVSRYTKKQLASFIIVRGNSQMDNPQDRLHQWTLSVLQKTGLSKNHPDVVRITKNKKSKFYQIDSPEMEELFSSQKFRPLKARYRLIFVEDAHLLSERLLNKLLKTLEEPQSDTCIIFLSPTAKKFLPTIESRAVVFSLSEQRQSSPPYYQEMKKQLDFYLSGEIKEHSMMELIQKNHENQDALLHCIIDRQRDHPGNFQSTDSFLREVRWFLEAQTHQTPPEARVAQLLQSLKRHNALPCT